MTKPVLAASSQTAEIEPSLEPSLEPAAAEPSSSDKDDAATKTASVERKAHAVAQVEAPQIALNSGSGEATGSLPKSGANSGTLWRDAGLVFIFTLAALLALSATLLLRRRRLETMPVPVAPLPRRPATTSSTVRSSGSERESAATHQQTEAPANRLRLWDEDWLPATMSEALDVLGVDPDTGRDTMKITVKRLRRAMHPDHALDEEDRALRERRLKQINVAWDIVCGKRRAHWLSVKSRSS